MIVFIAGARPNYAKLAPLARECVRLGVPYEWIDLSQNAFDSELNEFGIPKPAYRKFDTPDHRIGSIGSYANLQALSYTLKDLRASFVVVLGDVTSAHIGALAALYANIPLAHVEAGLRSPDARVEDAHRRMIDHIAHLNFATNVECQAQLERERTTGKCLNVGNVMHDQFIFQLKRPFEPPIPTDNGGFSLITIHRAENLRVPSDFYRLVGGCVDESRRLGLTPVLMNHPRHPQKNQWEQISRPAWDAHSMAVAVSRASIIFTDSGGIQDEALIAATPTVVLRKATERLLGKRQGLYTEGGVVDRVYAGERGTEILPRPAAPKIIQEILYETRNRNPGPCQS